jgi:hypothetical protein
VKGRAIDASLPHLDAKTFQRPLGELAETIALKVQREGHKHSIKPVFVTPDIYFLLRQAQQTFNLLFFINADETREANVGYRIGYSAAILPLVRTMIDCLYNITAILNNPGPKGYQFRESGLRRILQALDADERRYGGDPKWDAWIAGQRKMVAFLMETSGLTESEVRAAKPWPTLGRYLRTAKGTPPTEHQQFLRRLTYGFWQEYSGISHATFQGVLPIAAFFTPKDMPHEHRRIVEERVEVLIARHVPRVAAILLCTLTEVQAYFRFDRDQSARINQRLHQVWNALLHVPEIKELYDERYVKLMSEKGINP